MTAANPLMMSRKELEIEIGSLRRQLDEKRVQIQRLREEFTETEIAFRIEMSKRFDALTHSIFKLNPDEYVEQYAFLENLRRVLFEGRVV